MAGSAPYVTPPPPYRSTSFILAIVVHIALLLFFWVGISWKNTVPLAVEAEIWDMQYKDAAPLPEPIPEPEPVKPDPVPETKPEPAPPPPPKEVEKPVENPEIAIAKEKKRKEEQRKADAQKEKDALLKKQEEDKLAKQKEADEKKKAEAEKQKTDDAKKKADADKLKQETEAKKKADAEKQKKDAAQAKAAEQRRKEELQRMMSQAGGSGTAEKSQGPRGSADYASKIAVKIRSNTFFEVPPALAGNPPVEYAVDLLPDGSIRGIKKTKSSGVAGFDEAVARAIEKSQPFPPDKDGKVPNSFNIVHRPKDQ